MLSAVRQCWVTSQPDTIVYLANLIVKIAVIGTIVALSIAIVGLIAVANKYS